MLDNNFQYLFVAFLWKGTILPFFHSDGKTTVSTHCFKIVVNVLKIAEPQVYNICMLILSWPRALLESKF